MPTKIHFITLATVLLSAHLTGPQPADARAQKPAKSAAAIDSLRQEEESTPPASTTVELAIDYGDGVQKRFLTVPWKKDMTVQHALRFAQSHPRGIQVRSQGKGSTALLLQIDDLKNQGGKGLNWIFRVNGQLGKTSYATASLQPGDTVLWKFDVYK